MLVVCGCVWELQQVEQRSRIVCAAVALVLVMVVDLQQWDRLVAVLVAVDAHQLQAQTETWCDVLLPLPTSCCNR